MTDRAFSLLRTVLFPVLSTLRRRAGGESLPVAPHHGIPALHLGGVILERRSMRDVGPAESLIADTMYGGIYEFGGVKVEALPDDVFACSAPGPAWKSGLLRMDWLAGFRTSGRALHGLFALRLLACWMKTRPARLSRADQTAQLFNLALHAPAIAGTQSPAAIALATAAILRAQHPVNRLKVATPRDAFERSKALLAAHLATRQVDSQRTRLVADLEQALSSLLHVDGSLVTGSVDDLCNVDADLTVLTDGLSKAGDGLPPGLVALRGRMSACLALLTRPDGTLAFAETADLQASRPASPVPACAIAPHAGHARLSCGQTVLIAALASPGQAAPFRAEMSDAGRPLLWLERSGDRQKGHGSLICATGGTLLEINGAGQMADRQHIALFLSGDGSDLRLEDLSSGHRTACYVLHVPDQTRLSTTHGGTGAMIVPATGLSWQLLVRGARVEMEQGFLRVFPETGPAQGFNLALKRIARTERAARPVKSRGRDAGTPRLL